MRKVKRKIIKIDEEKCNGCGNCIPACPEQAMQIVETSKGKKAKLVKEFYCDGLGACLGSCPQDAITVEERVAEAYNEDVTVAHIKEVAPEMLKTHLHKMPEGMKELDSQLRQWPIQLSLVPPDAPYFQDADLTLVADCVPFAYPNFHIDFVKNNAIAIGCPKLDDVDAYVKKVTQILERSDIKSLKVVHMEVPCCYGLVHVAKEALDKSGKDIPFESVIIGIRGKILKK